MSAVEHHRPRRSDAALSLVLWLALIASLVPLLRVLAVGTWLWAGIALSGMLLLLGWLLRLVRTPALLVSAAEVLLWVAAITSWGFPGAGLWRILPSVEAIAAVPPMLQRVGSEILLGVPPLTPSAELTMTIVAATGLVAILLDHVVLTARMPLLAGVVLIAIWLIPALAVPSRVDEVAFVLIAAAVLALLGTETRTRERPYRPTAGMPLLAAMTAITAIIGAMAVAAVLPQPTGGVGGGLTTIDASLDLGQDLRERSDTVVLTYASTATTMPKLRVATLSRFDGDVWEPDRLRSVSLEEPGALPAEVTDEQLAVREAHTHIEITALSSAYLPVPFPAVSITGLEGAWRAVPFNHTVFSNESGVQGQSYDVLTRAARPTLEQIRASTAVDDRSQADLTALPEDMPTVISETAQQVTAGAETDYDRLLALQSWFRGAAFTYSLTAPVSGRFDGTSADAVAEFLEVKEGYCVHFAGAFALMARSLGIPVRIVVGFLPGEPTGDTFEEATVFDVTTSQLHAWPEVLFEGIGWVEFEPTKSLGVPTSFTSGESGSDEDPTAPTPTPETTAPAPQAPTDPDEQNPQNPQQGGGSGGFALPSWLLAIALGALVCAAPALVGAWRRQRLLRQARGGDAAAAWRFVQDAAIDVGADVPASETPRTFATRLIERFAAPAAPVRRLAAAIERASYGPPGDDQADLSEDARAVRASLLALAGGSGRSRALIVGLPRSLRVRPWRGR